MKSKIFLIILLLFTFFLLLPQLRIPWMIIDDGESARVASELSEHFARGDISWLFKLEAQNGLLRPSYWLLHFLNFSLLGYNATAHHFSHLLLFLAIATLIFLLTVEISDDCLAGSLSGLFLLLFGPARENFYRLGTGEPGLVFFLLGTFYFLVRAIRRNSWLSFSLSLIFLIFAWFSKTTVVVLIPLAVFILFLFFSERLKNARKFSLLFLLANLILAAAVKWIMAKYQIEGGYGSQYTPDPLAMWSSLVYYLKMIIDNYGLIILLILLSFVWHFFFKFKSKKISLREKWPLVALVLFTLFLIIQTPWPYLMGRYLPPALIGLSVVAGIELSCLLRQGMKFFLNRRYLGAVFFLIIPIVLLGNFIIPNLTQVFKMYQEVIPEERRRAQMVNFLAQNAPRDGRLFVNFSDGLVEFLYEVGLNLQIFYNRSDIKTNYLFLDNGFQFKKGDIIVTGPPYSHRYSWDQVRKTLKYEQELRSFDGKWEIIEVSQNEEVLPITSATIPRKYSLIKEVSFKDGEKLVRISVNNLPLTGGEISFFWKPPGTIKTLKEKIPLVRQGEKGEILPNGLFVFSGKDYLTFGIFDPWENQWRLLTAYEEFLPQKNYKVVLGWGKKGMTLKVGRSYQFLPYYAKLNLKADLIIGPLTSEQPVFEEVVGEIYEFQIFNE